jgi:hypothetical protein
MASYGIIYEFRFDDINGGEIDIFIAKKNYTGPTIRRALGRAPILRRERNGNILGTSLEIYAECRIDGEFAQLYTSSADEFRVEVYKRQLLQWRGFVSPELYSEPDIAPPYDVQIIATDGLGELKNHNYTLLGSATLRSHIQHALASTSLQGEITLISSLAWEDNKSENRSGLLLEMETDLSHMTEETAYDVLQNILSSLNACITQQDGAWMIIRESDLYLNILKLPPVVFGSADNTHWWPIGNLSADIIPAKKEISVTHENEYRENILPPIYLGIAAGWEIGLGCHYSTAEGGWIVPAQTGLSYKIDFSQYPLHSDVLLRIKARCLAKEGMNDASKLSVYMERNYEGSTYYLMRDYSADEDRVVMRWSNAETGYVYAWEAPFVEQNQEPEPYNIEVLIPISDGNYAESLDISIGNPYPSPYLLCIYSIELTQANQTPGSKVTVSVANGAREKLNEVKVALASFPDASLSELQYGIIRYDGGIKKWRTPSISADNLHSFIARDVAMQNALPRMRYRGKINVPNFAFPRIPVIFERDETYYFLNTYSYDLLNCELEVELISIPNASVKIESETVTELEPGTGGGSSSGSGGGSSGGGSSTTVITPSLEELTDTVISSPKNGHTLIYENGKWVNKNSAGGSAALETDIVAGVSVGYISKSATLSVGMTFTEFVQMMFSQGVKTVPPLVSLAGVPSQPIEVGTEITLKITSSFKDGYFANTDEGTTEAGCKPGTASFALNGLPVQMPHTFVASSAAVNTISVSQPYEASTVKPTKGGAELTDTIPAGTASAESTFVVGYRAFWGYMTDDEAESIDSAAIRGLEHTDTIINPTQNSITLLNAEDTIPSGKDLIIAIPSSYDLSEVVNKENQNFVDGFTYKTVTVQCAGEVTALYKIYRYDNQSAWEMDIIKITIKA